jgi:hypothetical protein
LATDREKKEEARSSERASLIPAPLGVACRAGPMRVLSYNCHQT